MAEAYTDEELRNILADKAGGFSFYRVLATAGRLLHERDEARRVARSVAGGWMTFLMTGKLPDPAPDVDTALAYPEAET